MVVYFYVCGCLSFQISGGIYVCLHILFVPCDVCCVCTKECELVVMVMLNVFIVKETLRFA